MARGGCRGCGDPRGLRGTAGARDGHAPARAGLPGPGGSDERPPSRHRTVAELTALAVAVSAVVALRRRGTSGGEGLVALAPVLVGVIAALLLVRLHPLPLRALARPVGRLRGLTGKLALARAAAARPRRCCRCWPC